MSHDPCARPSLLSVAELQQQVLDKLQPLAAESVVLEAALNRVLAEDIHATVANPRFDNSAMDGFALGAEALSQLPGPFAVVGQRLAGDGTNAPLGPREALGITTGARVPQHSSAVVMQEQCRLEAGQLWIEGVVKPGANIRRAGEDIKEGQLLLARGTVLQPAQLMLLASQGLAQVPVVQRPVVAVLSTGDELQPLGESLSEVQIYDSNRPYLLARLRQAGMQVVDCGKIPDCPERIEAALRHAASQADCVVSSGGVSVGEADWLKRCVESLGRLLQWKVRLKPGKPVAWGEVLGTPFLGLPGNPVSSLVCAELFVLPALRRLAGQRQPLVSVLRLPLAETLKRKAGREEYLRVALLADPQGQTQVHLLPGQGSAALANLGGLQGLLRIPAEAAELAAGSLVEVLPCS